MRALGYTDAMALAHRRINVKFQLGQGDFGKAGFDTVEVSGLRVQATITKAGGVSMSEANLRIYGLPLDVMNKLTILNVLAQYNVRRNVVTVFAGDDDNVSVCFVGNIVESWADMHSGPDAVMLIRAVSGYVQLLEPIPPTSYKGSVDAATILAGLALQWRTGPDDHPLTLENSGVAVQLTNPYYPGTLLTQITAVARTGHFNCIIDETESRLAIWPYGGVRNGLRTVMSPDTGMVGYPAYTQNGLQLTTLYNPSLTFGTLVEVRSQLLPASGGWSIATVGHDLESETPGGKWFTRVECGLIGQATPIIAAP